MIETVAGSVDAINGATIVSGTVVDVTSASTLTLRGGTIGLGAVIETLISGTLTVSGTVANSGILFASGADSTIAIEGVVNGGIAQVGDGVVEVTSSSENVAFVSTGIGGLQLDGTNSAYKGRVTGFGSAAGGNSTQFLDFTAINFATESFTYTSGNTSNTSGTLRVTDGTHSATVTLVGSYTSANFSATDDGSGHLMITDPPVVNGGSVAQGPGDALPRHDIDLPNIAFGAQTTLAYADNGKHTAGTLTVTDGRHAASLVLLGNYMAASFVAAPDGHGGTLVCEAQQTQQPLLAHPPHG